MLALQSVFMLEVFSTLSRYSLLILYRASITQMMFKASILSYFAHMVTFEASCCISSLNGAINAMSSAYSRQLTLLLQLVRCLGSMHLASVLVDLG